MIPITEQAGKNRAECEAEIDAAFAENNHHLGLILLRALMNQCPDDAQLCYRLAVVEEQIGLAENTSSAYLRCLQLAPLNPLAYLYAGYWFYQLGDSHRALSLFSRSVELDESVLAWVNDPGQTPQTRERSQAANIALRKHFGELHRNAVGGDDECSRIAQAVWTRIHDQLFEFATPGQQPQLFYIPGLSAEAFIPAHTLIWTRALEAVADSIVEEISAAMPALQGQARPYLEYTPALDEAFPQLAGSLNWKSLDLYRNGVPNEPVIERFPVTLDALGEVPLYCLDEHPFEVFVSTLRPGQRISAHYGLSNHSLTVHLPLIVPQGCWLRVAQERIFWEPGQLVVFDDTFDHEAMNGSDRDRAVLIFSIWHPDLSAAERAAVQRSFKARRDWLIGRDL